MSFIKKFLELKNAIGLVIIGLVFAGIGGMIIFSGNTEDMMVPIVFAGLGILLVFAGIAKTVRELKKPASDKNQYDRVSPEKKAMAHAMGSAAGTGVKEDFVYHFTGKMNQDQIMKDSMGAAVYEALCEKVTMVKDTPYLFCDRIAGTEEQKMIGHSLSRKAGLGAGFYATISSSFQVDGRSVWDVIADMGYGFRFSMNGIAPHYEVEKYGENVGYVESAGTGAMNPKYANNPIGKMPAKGIFRVRCSREDIPGFFLICYALSRTDETLN